MPPILFSLLHIVLLLACWSIVCCWVKQKQVYERASDDDDGDSKCKCQECKCPNIIKTLNVFLSKLDVKLLRKLGCYPAYQNVSYDHEDVISIPYPNYSISVRTIAICYVIYHLWNIIIAFENAISHNNDKDWCPSLEANVIVLQIESFVLYCCGLYTLTFRYHLIKDIIDKSYKPLVWEWYIFAAIIIGPYISGLLTGIDTDHWEYFKGDWGLEAIIYLTDIVRYIPPIIPVIILYGYLKTFGDKMDELHKNQFPDDDKEELIIHSGLEISKKESSEEFNHYQFHFEFREVIDPYKTVLAEFWWFIILFFLFNLATWCFILWSLLQALSGNSCKLSVIYYAHYLTEIIYFFMFWAVIGSKLCHNYLIIKQYKNKFINQVAKTERNYKDIFITVAYLESLIENSPFAVFGVFNPSLEMYSLITFSVVFPLLCQIIEFCSKE